MMGGAKTPGAVLLMERTQQFGPQVNVPDARWSELQSNFLSAKSATDEALSALPKEPAVGADAFLMPVGRIAPVRQIAWKLSRTGAIQLCGGASVQRFMWPYLVVDISPVIGLALAGGRMNGRMRGDFDLVDPMHLFMGSIILRMGRATIFHTDAQPTPPYRQPRIAQRSNATEGGTVVDPNRLGQPVVAEDSEQGPVNMDFALVGQESNIQQEPALQIADRQGFNPRAVAGPIPAFEVDGPDIVGTSRHGACSGRQLGAAALVPWFARHQLQAVQPAPQSAGCWQPDAWVELSQPSTQFAGTPGWMTAAQLAQCQPPAWRQLLWRVMRSSGSVTQTITTRSPKATQPLVTGRAGNLKLMAHLCERLLLRQGGQHETFTRPKKGTSRPRHGQSIGNPRASNCIPCPVPAL